VCCAARGENSKKDERISLCSRCYTSVSRFQSRRPLLEFALELKTMNAITRTLQRVLRLERPDLLTLSALQRWQESLAANRPAAYLLGIRLPNLLNAAAVHGAAPWVRFKREWRARVSERCHWVHTGLAPGYHDADRRMLHANFQLLTDFIEIELAAIERASPSVRADSCRSLWPGRPSRSRTAGLARLAWLQSLRETEEGARPGKVGARCREALIADEQEALYRWWTESRAQRCDPEAALTQAIRVGAPHEDLSETQRAALLTECEKADALQASYDLEDEMNLIRLMRIRKTLWS
jgi:hypothetical protein